MAEMTNSELIKYARHAAMLKSNAVITAHMSHTHLTIKCSEDGRYLTVHNQYNCYLTKVDSWFSAQELNLFHEDGRRNKAIPMPVITASDFRKNYPHANWTVELVRDVMTEVQRKNLEAMREHVISMYEEWNTRPIVQLINPRTMEECWMIWHPDEFLKVQRRPHSMVRNGGEVIKND